MDFVFNCVCCHGPLIARTSLSGRRVQCAHCHGGIEACCGNTVTEAVIEALLDTPLPAAPASQRLLRRVRPAAGHSSTGISHDRAKLSPTARISKAR